MLPTKSVWPNSAKVMKAARVSSSPRSAPTPTDGTSATRASPVASPALVYRSAVKGVRTCLELRDKEPAQIDRLEHHLLAPLRNPVPGGEDAAVSKFIAAYLRLPKDKQKDPYISAIAKVMQTTHTTMTAYLGVINAIAKYVRDERAELDRQCVRRATAEWTLSEVDEANQAAWLRSFDYSAPQTAEEAIMDLNNKVRNLEGQQCSAEQLLRLFDATLGPMTEAEAAVVVGKGLK